MNRDEINEMVGALETAIDQVSDMPKEAKVMAKLGLKLFGSFLSNQADIAYYMQQIEVNTRGKP